MIIPDSTRCKDLPFNLEEGHGKSTKHSEQVDERTDFTLQIRLDIVEIGVYAYCSHQDGHFSNNPSYSGTGEV